LRIANYVINKIYDDDTIRYCFDILKTVTKLAFNDVTWYKRCYWTNNSVERGVKGIGRINTYKDYAFVIRSTPQNINRSKLAAYNRTAAGGRKAVFCPE